MEDTRKNSLTESYSTKIGGSSFLEDFKTYFLAPVTAGAMGFAAFFSLIFLTKLFSFIFGISASFGLNLNDIILSLTGFLFAAGAKFLEFFGKED